MTTWIRCLIILCAAVLTRFPATIAAQTLVDPPQLSGAVDTPSDAFDVLLVDHYALVPDYASGLQIIDVADVSAPAIVGSYDTPGFSVQCAREGNVVFIADHEAGGVQVINIADPAAPTFVGERITGEVAVMVALRGNMVAVGYLAGSLELLDVSTPSQPVLIATYDTPGAPRHAEFDGDFLYIADNTFGLLVLDISTPSTPTLAGNASGDRPVGLALSGNILYLADGNNGLRTFDITSPATPQPLDAVLLPGPAVKVELAGNYALVADHVAGGLQLVDVTTPSDMSPATGYVTGKYAHGVAVAGDFAFLADGVGLKIFRVFDSGVPVRRRTLGSMKLLFR